MQSGAEFPIPGFPGNGGHSKAMKVTKVSKVTLEPDRKLGKQGHYECELH